MPLGPVPQTALGFRDGGGTWVWGMIAFLGLLVLVSAPARADGSRALTMLPQNIERHFTGFDGALVIFQVSSGTTLTHNAPLARRPLPPNSTFKIPHTLIAYDAGVVTGPDFALEWDGRPRAFRAWNRDHTLRTAMSQSVVWFYQEIAQRLGAERMREGLARLDYGNQDISGGQTRFWLQSSLRISLEEQVLFMRKLMAEVLPASPAAQQMVKDLIVLREGRRHRLRGKTGTGADDLGDAVQGLFVGALETRSDRYVIATAILGRGATGQRARRISEAVLGDLELLD